MRYLTAGESHGPQLTVIVDGVPSHLPLSAAMINTQLARRQVGYGRSQRMKLERDEVHFSGGVQAGCTTGAPLCMTIANLDHVHWQKVWRAEEADAVSAEQRVVHRPRPGHGDLVGGIKYDHRNLRHILERASARETAARVAAGAVARQLLHLCGVRAWGHVVQIGEVKVPSSSGAFPSDSSSTLAAVEASPVRCGDTATAERMMAAIDVARQERDTLGGVLEIRVEGLPVGLGSCMQWDRKLDGRIAQAVLSVQAIKGVEFGQGFAMAGKRGSAVHDAIHWTEEQGFYRTTNRAGG